ncbi:hypothetical protein Q9L58_005580 [Maublancomyces gigas]|uniref:Uncharacterized protein n=1 Tax=Discina gigas TaxID=1032678 RepID=A0ABR3GHN7_9PEZI
MPSADLDARLSHNVQEPVPLNNLQLAWIGFRLKFGSRREDSVEYQSQSGTDSDTTSNSDGEYCSEQFENEADEDDPDGDEESERAKAFALTRWSEAILSRTGAARRESENATCRFRKEGGLSLELVAVDYN